MMDQRRWTVPSLWWRAPTGSGICTEVTNHGCVSDYKPPARPSHGGEIHQAVHGGGLGEHLRAGRVQPGAGGRAGAGQHHPHRLP